MRLLVVIDHRFDRTPDGRVWTMTSFPRSFWQRYLSAFEHVRIVARIRDVDAVEAHRQPSNGEGISFETIPYYIGPLAYLTKATQVKRAVQAAVGPDDAVLLRINGQLASCMEPLLRRTGRPYAVEVVGDPYDAFAPGYVSHPLRPFLRWWFPYRIKRQCAHACAAAYVTEHALQRRYPPAPDAFTTHYSSIVLTDDAFIESPRTWDREQTSFTLVIVGTLDNLSKGPDTLIEALALCVKQGLDLHLRVVGGGSYQHKLETQAEAAGVKTRVTFVGWVRSGAEVRAELDRADLFVLPSRQEGLSRATIEAMARALPCIATTIGGTAELLPDEELVSCNDPQGLARKIHEVLNNPARMTQMSARNLAKAHDYHATVLRARWTALYRHLRKCTEAWLEKGNGHR